MKFLITVMLVLMFCASGYIDTTDAEPSLDTARALVAKGSWAVFPEVDRTYFAYRSEERGPDRYFYRKDEKGNWYSKMGLVMPLLYVPCVMVSKTASLIPRLKSHEELVLRFLVSLVNPLLAALLCALIYRFFRHEGLPQRAAQVGSLFFTMGTSLFPYSKMAHREMAQALFIASVFYFARLTQRQAPNSWGSWGWAGTFAALGILTKLAFGIMCLPLIILLLSRPNRLRSIITFTIPVITALLIQAWYSSRTSSHWFITGYSPAVNQFHSNAWKTPFAVGFFQQILSWRSGIFIYSPFLLVSFLPLLARRAFTYWNPWRVAILSSILLQAMLYSSWISPLGNEALGPRYLVSTLPLFAFLWDKPAADWLLGHQALRQSAQMLGVVSLLWQLIFISVKTQEYWYLRSQSHDEVAPPQWYVLGKLFQHKLASAEETFSLKSLGFSDDKVLSLDRFETLRGFNFWWAHAQRYHLAKSTIEHTGQHSPPVSQVNEGPKPKASPQRPQS